MGYPLRAMTPPLTFLTVSDTCLDGLIDLLNYLLVIFETPQPNQRKVGLMAWQSGNAFHPITKLLYAGPG